MNPSDRRLTPSCILATVRDYAGGPIAFEPYTEPNNPARALDFRCYEVTDTRPLGWDHHAQAAAIAYEAGHSRVLRTTIWVNPPFSKRACWDLAAIQAGDAGVSTFVYAAYAVTSHIDRLNQHATCRVDPFRYRAAWTLLRAA